MDIRTISKAVAGGLAAAAGGLGTATIMIPADVEMPWWGYVVVGVANAALGALAVYWAPANRPAAR